MSSLQKEISFKRKKLEHEFEPYFNNNIIIILNLKKELLINGICFKICF